jgi:hypothetical protein
MKHESMPETPAAQPVGNRIATSSLVKRLVHAQGDPAKQRIRALLGNICDEKLLNFGLSAADIALLRAPNCHKIPLPTRQRTATMRRPVFR